MCLQRGFGAHSLLPGTWRNLLIPLLALATMCCCPRGSRGRCEIAQSWIQTSRMTKEINFSLYKHTVSVFHYHDRKPTKARSKGAAMPTSSVSHAFIWEKSREKRPEASSQELQHWDPQPTWWWNVRHQSKRHFCNETILLPIHSLK